MAKYVRFRYQPLLFLLLPLWALIYGLIPGFQNHEYALIAAAGDKGIMAGSVSLFSAYSSATTMAYAFSLIGLISSICIGIYGVIAAIFPLFRGYKTMGITVLALFGLMIAGYLGGSIMLVQYVDGVTRDFYLAKSGTFETYNAFAFINANFVLGMALPCGLLVWWVYVFVAHLVKKG